MKILLAFLMIWSSHPLWAQSPYDTAKIAPELLPNAAVVIRLEEQTFDLKSIGKATYTYKTAFTILNKNGDDAASFAEYYNRNSTIFNLRATLYDSKGVKVKEYKSSDFNDRSAISDGSVYEDGRVKQLDFLYSDYPYTIEYSFIREYYGIASIPSWNPVPGFGYSVEKSQYIYKTPLSISFKQLKGKGVTTDSIKVKDKMEYKWSCENVKAFEYEPLSTGLKNVTPWITLAPNDFEYDTFRGNMETWKNLGAWIYKLNSEPQLLPLPIKAKVASLTSDAKTSKEKISRLYQYLQANTRYVSVQLGIGGFKPINADKVAAVNYGDCKALSNYMKTLLNEAGIKSNLVVIGYDMPSMNAKFASLSQANHMILCVPLQKDTVWLECTSQTTPAGHLDNGCSDKNVLLITEEGGKIVRSPLYKPEDNFQKRLVNVDLKETGEADISVVTEFGDAQYDQNHGSMLLEPTEQRKRIMNLLDIPNFQLNTVNYSQANKDVAVFKENISVKSTQLLTGSENRRFITLNLMNRRESVPAKVADRKTYFSMPYGYEDVDEVVISIPKGYTVEYLPKELLIESEFGKYLAKAEVKGNTIVYNRTQIMNGKKFTPDKYNSLVDFYNKIYKADKVKGVFAKIETQ
jgi:hypothetical protein